MVLTGLTLAPLLFGQSPPSLRPPPRFAATGPAEVRPPSELKITLMDGSIVGGKLSVPALVIDTPFGTLKVPVEQIQSFAPGLQSHPEFQQKVDSLINGLGADAFADREKANAELSRLGPDIRGELNRQLKTAEAEKQMRLQKLVDDIDAARGDDEPDTSHEWVRDDVIVTPGFTIVGRITTTAFSVTSSYGTLQLKLSDIRQAHRDAAEPEDIRKSLAVSGTLINQHAFAPSGIRLSKGDQVTISATGTIQMTPWGGNQASGPDGAANFGTMQPGNIPVGTLIARVGNDDIMRVGSKYTFTATKAGVLNFGIAMQAGMESNQFPGEYQVKMHVVRKAAP